MTPIEKLKLDVASDAEHEKALDAQLVAAENEQRQALGADGTLDEVANLVKDKDCKIRVIKSRIDATRSARLLKRHGLNDAQATEFESQAKRIREQSSSALARFKKAWGEAALIQEITESAEDIIHRFGGLSDKLLTEALALEQRAAHARRAEIAKRTAVEITGTLDDLVASVYQSGDGPKAPPIVPAAYQIRDWARAFEEKGDLKQVPAELAMMASRRNFAKYERVFHLEFDASGIDKARSWIKVGTRRIAEPSPTESQLVESEVA